MGAVSPQQVGRNQSEYAETDREAKNLFNRRIFAVNNAYIYRK
jgi:hypothetical protein